MIADENLDHKRAKYAYGCIEEIKDKGGNIEKKYHSAVHSSSILVQESGLLQTLSFYISKINKKGDGGKNDFDEDSSHYKLLAKHILNWIVEDCNDKSKNSLLKSYHCLLNYTDESIIYKTQESKALMVWLNRFADAMLKSED